MKSARYSAFIGLDVVIDAPGKYLTRCGEVVEIAKASIRYEFGCFGVYSNKVKERWRKSGRLYFGSECPNDIVRRVCEPPRDQMWAYTNPCNSVADFRPGFSQHRDCGSLDAPEWIARGSTIANVTNDYCIGEVLIYEGGRHVVGGIDLRHGQAIREFEITELIDKDLLEHFE